MATEAEIQSETLRLCREAVIHCLDAIASDPRKFWLMGSGTGSREKLLAAYAALTGKTEAEVEECWLPNQERYEEYCRQREADERRLQQMEDEEGPRITSDDLRDEAWEIIGWTERLLDTLGGPDALLRLGFTEPERQRFTLALHPSY